MSTVTKISVEEMNKMISEFMGRKFFAYKDNNSYTQGFATYEKCLDAIIKNRWEDYEPCIGWNLKFGKYHESWDWLMPVVRKIATLVLHTDWENIKRPLNRWRPICNELEKVNLENTHYCVYQFIKWYNNYINTTPSKVGDKE